MSTSSIAALSGSQQTANAETAASSSAASGPSLDYNAFLKLLIAQMQNQDPMQPMDSSDYVAQLATFSQVEQSIQSNDRLSEILTASHIAQAGSLVGHEIVSADGLTRGEVVNARIEAYGVVAVLADGREVPVVPGVVVGSSSE
ncbi:MAG: flagellar hook assembly protein FlgD [Hyphomicrobiaceae bacterium]|nr:flagellar hook assembly protein FlgD [Hyphomicrobiaceae bacterium]